MLRKTFLLFYLRFISRNKSHFGCKTEKFSFLFIARIKAKSFIIVLWDWTLLCSWKHRSIEREWNWNGCKIERTMKRRRRERWSINDSYDRWILDEALALNIKTFSIHENGSEKAIFHGKDLNNLNVLQHGLPSTTHDSHTSRCEDARSVNGKRGIFSRERLECEA